MNETPATPAASPKVKLYIATPAHDHRFDAGYVFSLLRLIQSGLCPIRPSKVGGAGVARARNNQAAEFLKTDCTHFFCIDSDITYEPAHVAALLRAGQPVVCGLYALKQHELIWCTGGVPGSSPDPVTGLQEVLQSGTGFMCVERRVFEHIIERRPDLAYVEDLEEGRGDVRHDFFGMGVRGDRTAVARLDRITRLIARPARTLAAARRVLAGIARTIAAKGRPGQYRTEDWSFCDLVRSLGFKVYVDTRFHVQHTGIINFPLKDPFASEADSLGCPVATWPAEALKGGVPAGHAADVLAGAYDVPVEYKRPPVILDIGANLGAFALWASLRWAGARIHCYEPHPENFRLLKVATSALKHVRHHPFGIGRSEWKQLHEGLHNCGECSFFDLGEQADRTVAVKVRPAATLPKADLIKIDTEGAELEILTQLARAGGLRRPSAVVLEYHRDTDRIKIKRLLHRSGFRLHAEKRRCRDRGEMKFVK